VHLGLPDNLAACHPGYFVTPNLHRRFKNNHGDERPVYLGKLFNMFRPCTVPALNNEAPNRALVIAACKATFKYTVCSLLLLLWDSTMLAPLPWFATFHSRVSMIGEASFLSRVGNLSSHQPDFGNDLGQSTSGRFHCYGDQR
jgi:NADH:ubiquinone oxidoreductase subunit 3 (subunit A)